ncbi:MAG TPA: isoprenylcysteine carboxylmethyltransferase family protein [Bryobacteraceae bacterium]|jgi:protein-S-isoprenylcysteine O-methyltransferase Ste14|nr:isoprenylcysteine carboxylmethyltransferase family protein [Bryobacteraceae bacterium]
MSFPKPYADIVAKLRVPCGFVLLAAFVWFSAPTWTSLAAGLPVSVLGLAIRAWAAGHLEKNLALAESGPYAHVRNPLYLGTLGVATGFVIASRRWELGILFAVVFLLIYLPVVELEEQHLRSLFPSYAVYAQRVPKLLPRFSGNRAKHFQWSLYRRNREYEALAGFLAGVAVLCFKALK